MKWKFLKCCFCLFVVCASLSIVSSATAGGLAYWVNCQDSAAALALAEQPTWHLHARCASEAEALALRKAAAEKGILSRKFWADSGTASEIPFADHSLDLIICKDLAAITPEAVIAWRKALTPHSGKIRVPSSANKEVFGADARIKPEGDEMFVSFPAPAGGDVWSHRRHGPDNNFVSTDSLLKPPFAPQWYALPLHGGFWGMTNVSAGGRLYSVRSYNIGGGGQGRSVLECRSLGNGLPLWQYDFFPNENDEFVLKNFSPGRSFLIARDDELLVALGGDVVHLDGDTGVETSRIVGIEPDSQIKWMTLEGDTLYALVGEKDTIKPNIYQVYPTNSCGRIFVAWSLSTGKVLWRIEEDADVDERSCALREDALYYNRTEHGIRKRSAKTGKEVWTSPPGDLLTVREGVDFGGQLISTSTIIAGEKALACGATWTPEIVLISATDGKELWRVGAVNGRSFNALILGDTYWTNSGGFDILTGEQTNKQGIASSGNCGTATATPELFISGFGACTTYGETPTPTRLGDVKGACDVGVQVANGIAFSAASGCQCGLPLNGWRAFAAARDFDPHAAPTTERRTVFSTDKPAILPVDTTDWVTYRQSVRRSGASPAQVGIKPATAWHWQPKQALEYTPSRVRWPRGKSLSEENFRPTAAIAAADKTWFADSQGILRCLESATGKEVWSLPLDAELFTAPTYYEGCIFAGDVAGFIHCLDASTGKPLWRYQVAPSPRYIQFHAHRYGTWPIIGGVAIHEGTVYAIAGFQKANGIHAVALDAKTGELRWSRDDAGLGGPAGLSTGYSNCGVPTIAGGRLWIPSDTYVAGSFDLATGEPIFLQKTINMSNRRGMLAGAFGENWVLFGGRRFWITEDMLGATWPSDPLGGNGVSAVRAVPDDSNPDATNIVSVIQNTNHFPVWDNEIFAAPAVINSDFTAWASKELLTALDKPEEYKNPYFSMVMPSGTLFPQKRENGVHAIPADPAPKWSVPGSHAVSAALTANALILAVAVTPENAKLQEPPESWAIVAYNRASGSEMWRVELPAQPCHDALSIDRDGRILLPLRDGSLFCLATK